MPMANLQYSAGDLVRWEKTLEKRDRHGAEWCKLKGIGKDRRLLDRALPHNVIPILDQESGAVERAMAHDREQARAALKNICSRCRRCELGW